MEHINEIVGVQSDDNLGPSGRTGSEDQILPAAAAINKSSTQSHSTKKLDNDSDVPSKLQSLLDPILLKVRTIKILRSKCCFFLLMESIQPNSNILYYNHF